MLEPCGKEDPAIILEFKVHEPDEERTLEETVQSALTQIEEKHYAAALESKGIAPERIHKYGFAFEGKEVLIKSNRSDNRKRLRRLIQRARHSLAKP